MHRPSAATAVCIADAAAGSARAAHQQRTSLTIHALIITISPMQDTASIAS
jgi:hypothetical protein